MRSVWLHTLLAQGIPTALTVPISPLGGAAVEASVGVYGKSGVSGVVAPFARLEIIGWASKKRSHVGGSQRARGGSGAVFRPTGGDRRHRLSRVKKGGARDLREPP